MDTKILGIIYVKHMENKIFENHGWLPRPGEKHEYQTSMVDVPT